MEPITFQIQELSHNIDRAVKEKNYKEAKEALTDIQYLKALEKPKKDRQSRKELKKKQIPDTFNSVLNQVNSVLKPKLVK